MSNIEQRLRATEEERFMRWNRLFVVCCSSIILFSFAGCKGVVRINVMNINHSLTPLSAVVEPGETLEWVATTSDESFDVIFDSGLCTQKSPIHASYRKPARCTIAPQNFGRDKRPIIYIYSLEGKVDGKPLGDSPNPILVAPDAPPTNCKFCIGPQHCSWCRPPY
jgi:hypothetical protein